MSPAISTPNLGEAEAKSLWQCRWRKEMQHKTAEPRLRLRSGLEKRDCRRSARAWRVRLASGPGLKRIYGGHAYQTRRIWTTVSKWKVWGNRSARTID
jgi:hypothetical protein